MGGGGGLQIYRGTNLLLTLKVLSKAAVLLLIERPLSLHSNQC